MGEKIKEEKMTKAVLGKRSSKVESITTGNKSAKKDNEVSP
jgi:hypothetical protein